MGFGSTGHHKGSTILRGQNNEFVVAQFFAEKGYYLLRHHWLTPWAEVDLVMAHPSRNEVLIVEVKSRWGGRLLSVSQMARLQRAFVAIRARTPVNWDVCFRVAVVDRKRVAELLEFADLCR